MVIEFHGKAMPAVTFRNTVMDSASYDSTTLQQTINDPKLLKIISQMNLARESDNFQLLQIAKQYSLENPQLALPLFAWLQQHCKFAYLAEQAKQNIDDLQHGSVYLAVAHSLNTLSDPAYTAPIFAAQFFGLHTKLAALELGMHRLSAGFLGYGTEVTALTSWQVGAKFIAPNPGVMNHAPTGILPMFFINALNLGVFRITNFFGLGASQMVHGTGVGFRFLEWKSFSDKLFSFAAGVVGLRSNQEIFETLSLAPNQNNSQAWLTALTDQTSFSVAAHGAKIAMGSAYLQTQTQVQWHEISQALQFPKSGPKIFQGLQNFMDTLHLGPGLAWAHNNGHVQRAPTNINNIQKPTIMHFQGTATAQEPAPEFKPWPEQVREEWLKWLPTQLEKQTPKRQAPVKNHIESTEDVILQIDALQAKHPNNNHFLFQFRFSSDRVHFAKIKSHLKQKISHNKSLVISIKFDDKFFDFSFDHNIESLRSVEERLDLFYEQLQDPEVIKATYFHDVWQVSKKVPRLIKFLLSFKLPDEAEYNFCSRIGISPNILIIWKRGKTFLSGDMIRLLARKLHIDIRLLIEVANQEYLTRINRDNDIKIEPKDWQTPHYPIYLENQHDIAMLRYFKQHDPQRQSFGWMIFSGRKNPRLFRSASRLGIQYGLKDRTIIMLESHQDYPSKKTLFILSRALNIKLATLIHGVNHVFFPHLSKILAHLFPDQAIFLDQSPQEERKIKKFLEQPGSMGHLWYAFRKTFLDSLPSAEDLGTQLKQNLFFWGLRERGKINDNWVHIGEFYVIAHKLGFPIPVIEAYYQHRGMDIHSFGYTLCTQFGFNSMDQLAKQVQMSAQTIHENLRAEVLPSLATLVKFKILFPKFDMSRYVLQFHPELLEFFPELSADPQSIHREARRLAPNQANLNLPELIQNYMIKNKLSPQTMGDLLEVSNTSVKNFLKGQMPKQANTLQKLAELLYPESGLSREAFAKIIYLNSHPEILELFKVETTP